jgi:probable F420-dependent oxidoreductase
VSREACRSRLGRVGVWWSAVGRRTAQEERQIVRELEELGYPAFWFGESNVNKEAYTHAAILLGASERIMVLTGIASVYARDAQATKNAAWALAEAWPGRFGLGLGVSHAPMVEARGAAYAKPVATMRAYLDELDAADYGPPDPGTPPPILLAALRPAMLELARDRADGAHPYLVTSRHSARAREILGPSAILAPEQGFVLERDAATAREVARTHLATYLKLPNYRASWLEEGFGESDLQDGGSDALVDALVAWGDAEAVTARVREHLENGADHVCVQPIVQDMARGLAELRELAPHLRALG